MTDSGPCQDLGTGYHSATRVHLSVTLCHRQSLPRLVPIEAESRTVGKGINACPRPKDRRIPETSSVTQERFRTSTPTLTEHKY